MGASSGIGEALCQEYADLDYDIVMSARRMDELIRVQSSLPSETKAFIVDFDLKDVKRHKTIVDTAIKKFGKIDVVILNGGISQRSTVLETKLEVDRLIMEINYFGQVSLAKNLLPYFRKQGNGHFVVISSLTGKFGFFLRSAYAASKHALHGFFESLRLEEEKRGIKVTIVCPTLIKTNISKNAKLGDGTESGKMDPMQSSGMDPNLCARQIIKAQHGNKLEVVIGRKKISVFLKRFFPSLFHKMIAKKSPR